MAAARLDELPGWAQKLIERAPVARLGLMDSDDRPRVLPVTFAVADGAIWSAVDHKPKRSPGRELARVRWLRRRAEAALTVDRYEDDWSRLAWVQAIGEIEIHDDVADPVMAALAAKYPQYRERPPGGPFLRLAAERFVHWRAAS
jgi:PPOX class probable F420-dependent enzyme